MPTASVGELELCYEEIGEGDPLLMIMGIGAQLVQWEEDFLHGLADRGFRVIRFDNRDVGKSTRLDHLGTPDLRSLMLRWALGRSIDAPNGQHDMADDAVGLLDALGIGRAHVLGCSMGGMVAQQVAIRHPERVKSLTSIMSHPGDRLSAIPTPRGMRALLAPVPKTREQAQDATVRFFRVVGSPGFPFDEASVRRRAGMHFDRGQSPRGFLRQLAAIASAKDRRPQLQRLRIPALVVHGTRDPLVTPRGGYQTAKALPNAEFLRIEGMGHDFPRATWPRIFAGVERLSHHFST